VNGSFIPGAGGTAVAVDANYIYYDLLLGIGRANLDGTGANNGFITGVSFSSGVGSTPSTSTGPTAGSTRSGGPTSTARA
jgi:hypothetical protein